jgi:hypothetical protein
MVTPLEWPVVTPSGEIVRERSCRGRAKTGNHRGDRPRLRAAHHDHPVDLRPGRRRPGGMGDRPRRHHPGRGAWPRLDSGVTVEALANAPSVRPAAPGTCRRVVLTRHGGPDVLKVVTGPVPTPAAGVVRVRVEAAGVSAYDLMFRRSGRLPGTPPTPFTPGEDVVGIVDAVGEGVTTPDVGQRVAGTTVCLGVGGGLHHCFNHHPAAPTRAGFARRMKDSPAPGAGSRHR